VAKVSYFWNTSWLFLCRRCSSGAYSQMGR
jgi:hypothetical protein